MAREGIRRTAASREGGNGGQAKAASRLAPQWRALLPLAAFAIPLAVAFAAAALTGSPGEGVNARVEGLSASSSGLLGNAGNVIPLGFAFGVGMVSAVNPCGFSLLPAYLGLFLGDEGGGTGRRLSQQLQRALVVGGAVTAGFALLFAIAGLAIGAGAHFVVSSFPWIGFSVGVLLVAAGAYLTGGGKLYSGLGERLAAKVSGGGGTDLRSYFLFGLGYGTASLSCTLPIFLAVVGSSLAVSDLLPAAAQFALYALGMGTVIMALTISIALFRSSLVGPLRSILPYVGPASAALLLLAGTYIVYYWLTLGGLWDRLS